MNIKFSDSQLNKLKSLIKNQTRVTLRMKIKIFDGNNLPHELLLLTTRLKTKLINAFEKNMLTDINLPKAQIYKIIQSGGFLGALLSKIAGLLIKAAVPLTKNIFAPLEITPAASKLIQEFKRKQMVLEQQL